MGAAGGVGADHRDPPHPVACRQLGQARFGHRHVVCGRIGAGITGPQHHGQWFTCSLRPVERGQRVKPEAFLIRRLRVFLLTVGREKGRIHIHDQRLLDTGADHRGCVPGRSPSAGTYLGADRVDHRQGCGAITAKVCDQPGHGRIRGHRPEHPRLGPQPVHVGQAVAAHGQTQHQIQHDLPRIVPRKGFTPRSQCRAQSLRHTERFHCFGQQDSTGLGHDPGPAAVNTNTGIKPVEFFTRNVPS